MKDITIVDRLRYRFDRIMARGPAALIGWLAAVTALVVVAAAVIVVGADLAPKPEEGDPPGLLSTVWIALMHAMDAGTVAGDSGSRAFLAVMFAVTLSGIFIVSILVGLITNGIQGRIESLRKGRSLVCEDDHTVILGWSPQVFSILSELAIANESRKNASIAILADKDKVEMEDEIAAKCGSLRGTRVACRTGSPIDPADIAVVRPAAARSIIVLAPDDDDPDAHVIKTMLALVNDPDRKKEPYHIVAEIRDRQNLEAAKLASKNEAQLVCTEDMLSQITVQTCRQSGLSSVYSELLDFGGDEIYVRAEPSLVGKSFSEALMAYESCSVIGLLTEDGEVHLKPPMEMLIGKSDKIIAVAEDDSTLLPSKAAPYQSTHIAEAKETEKKPEKVLILGWNRRAPRILLELDQYVADGSSVTVVAEGDAAESQIAEIRDMCTHLTVTYTRGGTTDRTLLDKLASQFDHVVTLSYSDDLPAQKADARTLVTLLHLRDIEQKRGETYSIVSEMLDVRNRQLAEVAQPDDFIVSDKLVSLLLAQISENKHLAAVYADLFDPEGAEIYLKPAGDYVSLNQSTPFSTVVESARRRGEVAIGYLTADADPAKRTHVNPKKGKAVKLTQEDKVIVLANE
ncbi:MAG: potassium transporter TrkA [Polyangiaceae bacterium]|nr:potassium transporter TrkA [Polyangiaceae bacterium]